MGQRADTKSCSRCPDASCSCLVRCNQSKSRKAASSCRKTNPINLPSVPAPRYLHFQRVLMEINPSLSPAGMVNIRREERGEARTVEQGIRAVWVYQPSPKCGGTGPSRMWQGCSGSFQPGQTSSPPWPSRLPNESFSPTVTWRRLLPSPGLPNSSCRVSSV